MAFTPANEPLKVSVQASCSYDVTSMSGVPAWTVMSWPAGATWSLVDDPSHTYQSPTGPRGSMISVQDPRYKIFTTSIAGNYTLRFVYSIQHSTLPASTDTGTVTMNARPVATPQSVTLNEDVVKAITLSGTDASPLTYAVVTGPTKGTLSGTAPNLTYTPNANVNGTDSFTFTVRDGVFTSSAATVSITITPVNDPPTLTTVTQLTGGTEDTPYVISYATLSAAGNEQDIDSATINFKIAAITNGTLGIRAAGTTGTPTAVVAGTTVLDAAQELVWTPAVNANGVLSACTVVAYDGALASATAVPVTVAVAAVNDAPTLTAVTQLTGATEDMPFVITYAALLGAGNQQDVDSATINFKIALKLSGTLGIRAAGTTGAPTTVVAGTTVLDATQELVWTPTANTNGALSPCTVLAYDGTLASATPVLVTVSTTAVNDPPTFSFMSQLTGGIEDTPYVITYAKLLAAGNEQDIDSSSINFKISAVSSGTLGIRAAGTTVAPTPVAAGTTVLDALSELVWTPDVNASGSLNAFSVVAYDGELESNYAVPVFADVASVNDAPVATPKSVTTAEDSTIIFDLSGTDAEGSSLTYGIGDGPKQGQLYASGGFWTYTPKANFTGSDSFTFTVWDGALRSSPATVSIIVTPVNDPPTLSSSISLNGGVEDTPYVITFAALLTASNAQDVESAPITFRIATLMQGTLGIRAAGTTDTPSPVVAGTTMLDATKELVWIPPLDFIYAAPCTVLAYDGELLSTAAVTVQVTLAPVNDPPTLGSVSQLSGAIEDTPFIITYDTLRNNGDERDVDTARINFKIAAVSSGTLGIRAAGTTGTPTPVVAGTTVLDAAQELVWTPAANANGVLPVCTIFAYDGALASSTAVPVSMWVQPVNDAPTLSAVAQLSNAIENTSYAITYTALLAAGNEQDVDSAPINFRITGVSSGTLGIRVKGTSVAPTPVASSGGVTLDATHELLWIPALDASGVLQAFTVRAADAFLTSATDVPVQIVVAPVGSG